MDRGEGLNRGGLRSALLLAPPMLWLGVAYLGALAALFVAAFWSQNDFTGELERVFTTENFHDLVTVPVYRSITLRTLGIAVLVTVIDAALAIPVALYMAKVASPRVQRLLVIAVLMPLWASYLVKAYAWRGLLSSSGLLDAVASPFGLGTPGYGLTGLTMTLAYLWLPYMILPIYAGLERLPDSLLEASADLGAGAGVTLRRVVLPVVFPAVVAGSVFTFSLTMGDYIAVKIVGGTKQVLGNVVYDNVNAANNLPFAAAVATIPVVLMLAYLAVVRRTGALDNL